MSAAMTERLVAVAQAARAAGHGGKSAIYDAACQELGISRSTLLRRLKEVAVSKPRKRRRDAGTTALTREEAQLISGVLMASARKNEKQLYALGDAVQALRANGLIQAGRVNEETGEFRPLSESAIHRALRSHGLHPEQLLAPAPATELQSLHPNHVWQIDASLCVLYYLKPSSDPRESGLRVMDRAEFYKNKPRNLARIAADRVWSYQITDHASGWIYVEYVMGAESGENLCGVLINAMQERGGADLLHGVPRILYMDPGSANTAAMTRNLGRSLGIELLAHQAGNARATGQVENARNIIERKFEAGLRFRPINSLAELNALAAVWRAHFNATAVHARHGRTRTEMWMRIRQDQLIKAPPVEVCRELAVAEPEQRRVNAHLRISFRGDEYDVSGVPGVSVRDRVLVTRNPWRGDAAQVLMTDANGHEVYYVVPKIEKNEFGFSVDAPGTAVLGTGFRRHAETPAEQDRAAIDQLMTGTSSKADAEAARKAQAVPLDGQFDPYKHIDDTALPTFMPRRGTEHDLVAPTVELRPLSHVAAAKLLRAKVPSWSAQSMTWLKANYPDGVPEEQLEAIAAQLNKPARPKLRVVIGGE